MLENSAAAWVHHQHSTSSGGTLRGFLKSRRRPSEPDLDRAHLTQQRGTGKLYRLPLQSSQLCGYIIKLQFPSHRKCLILSFHISSMSCNLNKFGLVLFQSSLHFHPLADFWRVKRLKICLSGSILLSDTLCEYACVRAPWLYKCMWVPRHTV